MTNSKHIYYAILLVTVIIAAQTFYIQRIQKQQLRTELKEGITYYENKQKARDSLITKQLNEIINSDFKVREYYYTTKEKVMKNREKLQNMPDSVLSNILSTLIERRKRSSYFNQRNSNR